MHTDMSVHVCVCICLCVFLSVCRGCDPGYVVTKRESSGEEEHELGTVLFFKTLPFLSLDEGRVMNVVMFCNPTKPYLAPP